MAWEMVKKTIGLGDEGDDSSAGAAIDEELKAAMDMPLYNDEAKYFLADYHQLHTLSFKDARTFAVDLDKPPKERWAAIIDAHKEVMPRVK